MKQKITNETILNQEILSEIESLCTQEEPPACNSSCPFHMDVKGFLKECSEGNVAEAYSIYSRKIPFSHLMSYICEAPCEKKCLRYSLGGSIQIQALENFIITNSEKTYKTPPFLPKKKQKIAIIGGGLRGMTAALELAKKGYSVIIYEKGSKLGGRLNKLSDDIVLVLKDSIDYLLNFSVTVEYDSKIEISNLEDAEMFQKDIQVDALYIAYDNFMFKEVDTKTGRLDKTNIFSGSRDILNKDLSVTKAYDGKTIALTIERVLNNVSVLAGREKEVPFDTTLFTNIEGVKSIYAIKDINSIDKLKEESLRCIQCECMECVKGCTFMRENKSYPKRLVREVFNNLSIVMGIHHANKLIGTCNLCGQCEKICPNGLSMESVVLAARERMVNTKKMPPSYYDFALMDMAYSNGENFFLSHNQQGFDKSRYLYFPSCQLAASEPDLLIDSYKDISEKLEGGVGLLLGCCGIMAKWAGEKEIFEKTIDKLKEEIAKLGNPTIITACPTCEKVLSEYLKVPVKGIWDIYSEQMELLPKVENSRQLVIHDACGARENKDIQQKMRNIIEAIGHSIKEPFYTEETSSCCGYGGLTTFVDSKLSNSIAKNRVKDMSEESVVYCVNCRDQFLKNSGKSIHFLELIYTDSKVYHRYPKWSERQNNRTNIKNKLLSELWEEPIMEGKDLSLIISDELEEVLEERMILHSDISNAIIYGEDTKEHFKDIRSGNTIVSHITGNVTFWVVYEKSLEGYVIYNAYSHRMSIVK